MVARQVDGAGGEEGFALLLVIWTLAILATIAVGIVSQGRADLAVTRNLLDAAQAEAAADGGVWHMVAALTGEAGGSRPRADGTPHLVTVGSILVDVAVQDEGGKVDLREADPQLIANLVKTAGVGEPAARGFVAALLAARAPKETGDRTVQAAQVETDLSRVGRIDPQVIDRLKPITTVYTSHAGINPATAPLPVLLSVPGVQASDVANYIRVRGALPAGAGPLEDFPSLAAAMPFFRWSDNSVVTITARAQSPNAQMTRVAVINFAPSQSGMPYRVLAWSVGGER